MKHKQSNYREHTVVVKSIWSTCQEFYPVWNRQKLDSQIPITQPFLKVKGVLDSNDLMNYVVKKENDNKCSTMKWNK